MPKYVCSFAHDIPAYADFVVAAKSERAALRIITKALRAGKFANVYPEPSFDNAGENERVFVQGRATRDSNDPTLEELIKTGS